MESIQLVAIVIITDGNSPNLIPSYQLWKKEGCIPGASLFYCGPKERLLQFGFPEKCIIDYIDPPYQGKYFHINNKKQHACLNTEAKYVYLMHDRFLPVKGFWSCLNSELVMNNHDYGSVDVVNSDGTPALTELRLKKKSAATDVLSALEEKGRMSCSKNDDEASDYIVVNGGQYFIRKELHHFLNRPMRWFEMEDEILSHDMKSKRGTWISGTHLVSVSKRMAPYINYSKMTDISYFLYSVVCNIIGFVFNMLSVGKQINNKDIGSLIKHDIFLVDPLHKEYASDYLPTTLEKVMTRVRLITCGRSPENVFRTIYGWRIICK